MTGGLPGLQPACHIRLPEQEDQDRTTASFNHCARTPVAQTSARACHRAMPPAAESTKKPSRSSISQDSRSVQAGAGGRNRSGAGWTRPGGHFRVAPVRDPAEAGWTQRWQGSWRDTLAAAQAELVEQSTLADLLQEARAQGVGHLDNSSEPARSRRRRSIRVHRCSSAAIIIKRYSPPRLSR